MGGKLETAFFAFGECDIVVIVELPNNATVPALSVAASATGAFKSIRTTPLMTVDEGIEMMRKASGIGYRPPGG